MGLDITAYKNLKKVKNPQFDEYGDLVNWETQWRTDASMEWSESVWPGRGEGVEVKTVYSYEEDYDFRAGSYSGYNFWRAGLESFKGDVAFQELIDFADNEGVIGPIVSKKLAKDFSDYEEEAKAYAKTIADGDWWFERYLAWKKAFEMASENGAVDFH